MQGINRFGIAWIAEDFALAVFLLKLDEGLDDVFLPHLPLIHFIKNPGSAITTMRALGLSLERSYRHDREGGNQAEYETA